MSAQQEKRIVDLVINNKSAEVSLGQIKKEVIALTKEFTKLKEADDPKLYAKKAAELKKLTQVYQSIRQEISGAKTDTQKFFDEFKTIAAGVLGGNVLTGLITQLQNVITQSINKVTKLSDELTNIGKTTNLTNDQLQELDDLLSAIDTRTGRSELRSFAAEAGKLGRDSVESVRKFVEEADKINVALGEDLGKDAIIEIIRLADIFGEEALNIGSAINSIGQASVATEVFQTDFLKRTAAIGKTVDLTANQLLGYGAAFEIAGQTTEVSGTALQAFIIEFTKDTEKFGAAAGLAKGDLTNLLASEGTNAAFLKFLKNFKESSKGAQDMLNKLDMLGIDGQRGAGALLALAQNVGTVIEQQKVAAESTGSILSEFNRRNNNEAANWEKTLKKLESTFTPIKKAIGGFFIGLGTWLAGSIGAILGFGKALVVTTVSILSYKAAVWLASGGIKNLIASAYSSIVPLSLQRAASLASATAMALLKGETVAASISFKMLTTAIKANPFGLIAAFIATAVTAFELFNTGAEEATEKTNLLADAQEEIAFSYGKEKMKIQELLKVANDLNASKEERLSAIKALNNISPEYLGFITEENIRTEKATKAINDYLDAYNKKIMAQALEGSYTKATETYVKADLEYQRQHDEIMDDVAAKFKDQNAEMAKQYILSRELMARGGVAAAKDELERIKKYAKTNNILLGVTSTGEVSAGGNNNTGAGETAKTKAQLAEEKRLDKLREDRLKKDADAIKAEYEMAMEYSVMTFNMKESLINYSYSTGLLNEKEYQDELYNLEVQKLEDSLRLHKEYNVDYADIVKQRSAMEVKSKEQTDNAKNAFKMVQDAGTFGPDSTKKDATSNVPTKEEQRTKEIEALTAVLNAFHENEMNNMEEEFSAYEAGINRRKRALENQLKTGAISQEKYTQEIETIDAAYANRQRAFKQEQWRRQHRAAITEATINGIVSVSKTLATYAYPYNLLMGALDAAIVGAKVAAIKSEPMPQFYEGGSTWVIGATDNRSYNARRSNTISKGGRFGSPTVGLIGERGPELVIPNYIYGNPNNANVMGAIEAAIATKQYNLGGSTGASIQNANSTSESDIRIIEQNTMVMQMLLGRLNEPLKAVTYFKIQEFAEAKNLEDKAKELGKF